MWILAAYFLVGIAVCVAVACSGEKRRDELPLAMLFDPIWPLFFLWPLWIAVVLVERSFPKEACSSVPAIADPIGQIGVVVSALRPVGRIQVAASDFEARSDERIIPIRTMVRVVSRSMGEFLNRASQIFAYAGAVGRALRPTRRG